MAVPWKRLWPLAGSLVLVVALLAMSGGLPAQVAVPAGATGTADGRPADSRSPSSNPSATELAMKGGPLMIPIALCSVVMLALAVERFAALRRARIMPQAFLDELQIISGGPKLDRERAVALCERFRSPIASLLRAALARTGRP